MLGGRTMLQRMCDTLCAVTGTVVIVGGAKPGGDSKFTQVEDRWPDEGPLGGIITALLHSRELQPPQQWNLIVSCDMPFLEAEWLRYLTNHARQSAAEVVMPRSIHGPEPLCGCYHSDAAEKLGTSFASGTRKITEGLQHVGLEMLDETHWKRFDSAGRLFWNMNTPADYEEARRIVERA
jgi:molybdopterin-guanine dinucleotide biosynthesis protein A